MKVFSSSLCLVISWGSGLDKLLAYLKKAKKNKMVNKSKNKNL